MYSVGRLCVRPTFGGPAMKLRAISMFFTLLTIASAVWVLAAPWKL